MRRTQIQLDEATYRLLRARAFERGISLAALVREAIQKHLGRRPQRAWERQRFTFVGAGHGGKAIKGPVSELHDEAFAESAAQ